MKKKKKLPPIRSGDYVKCRCGYVGVAFGLAHGNGISAPWCPMCLRNNKLTRKHNDKLLDKYRH